MESYRLIAPCGINCSLCLAYQRVKNNCPGCNSPDRKKANHCEVCGIKNCGELLQSGAAFCYSCGKFPCKLIKHLDVRYKTKYGMSNIQNLQFIESYGVDEFIKMEAKKWTCKNCGSLLCMHRPKCLNCGNKNGIYPDRG